MHSKMSNAYADINTISDLKYIFEILFCFGKHPYGLRYSVWYHPTKISALAITYS